MKSLAVSYYADPDGELVQLDEPYMGYIYLGEFDSEEDAQDALIKFI